MTSQNNRCNSVLEVPGLLKRRCIKQAGHTDPHQIRSKHG